MVTSFPILMIGLMVFDLRGAIALISITYKAILSLNNKLLKASGGSMGEIHNVLSLIKWIKTI